MVAPGFVALPQHGRITQHGGVGIRRGVGSGKYPSLQFGKKSETLAKASFGHPEGAHLSAINKSGGGGLKSADPGAEKVFLSFISGGLSPFSRWFLPAPGNPARRRRAVIHQDAVSTPAADCGELK